MAGDPATAPPPVRKLAVSDPIVVKAAPRWADMRVSTQPMVYHADRSCGPLSWTDLASRTSEAFGELGMVFADELKPQFNRVSTFFGPPAHLGYGWMAGETSLKLVEQTFYGDNYSSLVASLQFWVDPPLPRGADDTTALPHVWKVRVGVGYLLSTVRRSRHSGYVRLFLENLQTDDSVSWVPTAILQHFQ